MRRQSLSDLLDQYTACTGSDRSERPSLKGVATDSALSTAGPWLYWPHADSPEPGARHPTDPRVAGALARGQTAIGMDRVLPPPWAQCPIDLPPFCDQLGDLLPLVAPL